VVTVRGPHRVVGQLSVLARACGTEFYARHDQVGERVSPAAEWPAALSVRCDESDLVAESAELLERIRAAMADGTVKQVVVGPSSARVVWRCATADSGTYRVTRRVDLTQTRVDAAALEEVLEALDAVVALAETAVTSPSEAHRQAGVR